jgi:hypothetical protein
LRPRWPSVSCCTRRRTSSTARWRGARRGRGRAPRWRDRAGRADRWRRPGTGPEPPPRCRLGIRRHAGEPGLDHRTAAPQGDAEHSAPVQVDKAGDVGGAPATTGMAHHRLVQAQRLHALEASGIVHQGLAVVAHRRHGRAPANAEVPGHLGHRVVLLAGPPADVGPGPLGSDALAEMAGWCSLQGRTSQSAPTQRQMRLPRHHHVPPGDGQGPCPRWWIYGRRSGLTPLHASSRRAPVRFDRSTLERRYTCYGQ